MGFYSPSYAHGFLRRFLYYNTDDTKGFISIINNNKYAAVDITLELETGTHSGIFTYLQLDSCVKIYTGTYDMTDSYNGITPKSSETNFMCLYIYFVPKYEYQWTYQSEVFYSLALNFGKQIPPDSNAVQM